MFPSKMSIPCQNSRVSLPVTAMFHAPVPCWKAPQSQKNAPGPSEALWPGRTWSTAPIGRAPRPRPCPAPPPRTLGRQKNADVHIICHQSMAGWIGPAIDSELHVEPSPSRPIPRYIGSKRNQVNGSTAKVDLRTKAKREATQVRMERCWICYNNLFASTSTCDTVSCVLYTYDIKYLHIIQIVSHDTYLIYYIWILYI